MKYLLMLFLLNFACVEVIGDRYTVDERGCVENV